VAILRQRLAEADLVLADLVLLEVLQGLRGDEERFNRVMRDMVALEIFAIGGMILAIQSARNYRLLRSRGITIRSSIDCLIATFCINTGVELLHNDRDFDPFEQHLGLRVAR